MVKQIKCGNMTKESQISQNTKNGIKHTEMEVVGNPYRGNQNHF